MKKIVFYFSIVIIVIYILNKFLGITDPKNIIINGLTIPIPKNYVIVSLLKDYNSLDYTCKTKYKCNLLLELSSTLYDRKFSPNLELISKNYSSNKIFSFSVSVKKFDKKFNIFWKKRFNLKKNKFLDCDINKTKKDDMNYINILKHINNTSYQVSIYSNDLNTTNNIVQNICAQK